MKIGLCVLAFFMGCFMTVFMKANPPKKSDDSNLPIQVNEVIEQNLNSTQIVEMEIVSRAYGTTKSGEPIEQFICKNSNGYELELINYGATVTAFRAPDKQGVLENITLACTEMAGWEACTSYFGCTVGRFCNRIAQGKFSIDGTEFSLATNNGENHLHGGKDGWDKKVWKAEKLLDGNSVGIRFSVTSPEGDEGYPGEVQATVDYILDDDNQLKIIFSAKSNAKTHINLTNHCYWNLGGTGSGTILDHILQVNADHYLPVDETGIPTGEIAKTEATPFDFSKPTPIGSRIDQISGDPGGYDHNFVISEESSEEPLRLAATVSCPESGRKMEVLTTQPGIQFYTGNYLNGQPGSGGFEKHHGFCLETQHYPDSPNQTKFPSTLLEPGQEYRQTTIHRFSVQK